MAVNMNNAPLPPDAWLARIVPNRVNAPLSFEQALHVLSTATCSAPKMSFEWQLLDAIEAGTLALVYMDPNAANVPNDGYRWASPNETSQRVSLPLQPSNPLFNIMGASVDLEQLTLTRGYKPLGPTGPSPDSTLCRYRKRYRLLRSPAPQIQLVQWGIEANQAACPPVPSGWDRQPVRNYPLPMIQRPPVSPFVPRAPAQMPNGAAMPGLPGPPMPALPQTSAAMPMMPTAQSAPAPQITQRAPSIAPPSLQQNRPKPRAPPPAAQSRPLPLPQPGEQEYEQTADALDQPTRTLVAARYKGQHLNLSQVFDAWSVKDILLTYAEQGKKEDEEKPSSIDDEKARLRAELRQLKEDISEQERKRKERKPAVRA